MDLSQVPALLAKLDDLSARVEELEKRGSQASHGMDFLQRHEGLSLRRPTSHPSLASLQQQPSSLPRNASYTNLSHVEVPMPATRVVMTQVVSPGDTTGAGGICSGGTVLSWIDVAAGLAAKTLARAPVVTASLDTVHFLRPCKLQSIVTIAAMVNRVFASSMEVGVQVEEEDVATGVRHHCCSAYLTFVALSRRVNAPRDGPPPPKKLPPKVVPTDDYYREIYEEAAARRDGRLQDRQRLKNDPGAAAAEAACRLLPIAHRPSGAATLEPPVGIDDDERHSDGQEPSVSALHIHPTGLKEEEEEEEEGEQHDLPDTLPGTTNTHTNGQVPRRAVRPARTGAHMTQLIMPQHANSLGIAFGGIIMRWMEQCSFVAASRVARGAYLLTAAMDSIAFAAPTRVGDIMYIEAQATAIFGSSVEVMISVWAETPEIGGLFACGDAYATVVSMDENGVPSEIPFELDPETPEDLLRRDGAIRRRKERLRMRASLRRVKRKRKTLDGIYPRWGSSDDVISKALRAGASSPASQRTEAGGSATDLSRGISDEERANGSPSKAAL